MGLVDYSESESSGSEAEAPAKKAPKPQNNSKQPFQRFGDRSNPNKVVVNLPQLSSSSNPGTATRDDEPPSKRARTGGGGGLFSGLNSFLPAPKNANKPASTPSSSHTRPGIHLKTSAAPGFSRDDDDEAGAYTHTTTDGSTETTTLPPPPKKAAGPSIPDGQTPADDVKLVGKPLMFRPLSVARNPNKKKKGTKPAETTVTAATATPQGVSSSKPSDQANGSNTARDTAPAAPPKKVSLFSMHTEEPTEPAQKGGTYEPLFAADDYLKDATDEYAQYAASMQLGPSVSTSAGAESLDSIADDMNLSATARRELFGRDGARHGGKRVINFNMDREYRHNEEIRAAGEQQIHNPVRGLQGGGKHSLQKLVQNVRGQQDALEDSFAKGKTNRKEASSRYGW